ncbi:MULTISPECIES: glycosyltransferase [Acidiplasma]|uniref:glycosyltransferase n=1 Tax=Acidiplasma TaxID=507753 RepID=UPI00373FDBB5
MKNLKDVELYHIGIITDEKYKNYSYNIHQLGTVSEQEKFNYLQYANKFVFKTLCEGQGIPTMEAMRLGTQPVINDIPAHRYFL